MQVSMHLCDCSNRVYVESPMVSQAVDRVLTIVGVTMKTQTHTVCYTHI